MLAPIHHQPAFSGQNSWYSSPCRLYASRTPPAQQLQGARMRKLTTWMTAKSAWAASRGEAKQGSQHPALAPPHPSSPGNNSTVSPAASRRCMLKADTGTAPNVVMKSRNADLQRHACSSDSSSVVMQGVGLRVTETDGRGGVQAAR